MHKPAAQYLRMSTERQDFSMTHQKIVIAAYALEHGYDIVRTFADEGISGLGIDRREGLKSLLAEVLAGKPEFSAVLVYDVSRWGRFQNPDQAACYEFLCHDAGIDILYCAEQFANDGTITSVLLKNIKRVMAAEYSRELSGKVSRAQATLAQQGFWQGGPPGYGLRRQQVRADRQAVRTLEAGEMKGAGNGRTILVPGPPEEVATVRRIFDMYVRNKLGFRAIANVLNADAVPYLEGRQWLVTSVQRILTAERYAGAMVTRKTDRRMGARARRVPSENWLRTEGAFEPIVSSAQFQAAQRRRARLSRRYTDEEILEGLKRAFARQGRLSITVIEADPNLPSIPAFSRRFGSLAAAYKLIGYVPVGKQAIGIRALENRRHLIRHHPSDDIPTNDFMAVLRNLLAAHGRLTGQIIDAELGRWAYRAGARRFGGGRRMYALAGYKPNARQDVTFSASNSESISAEVAEALRQSVLAGADPPLEFVHAA
jgi:DNA invertase Pin-like site-specific DNA recombinase